MILVIDFGSQFNQLIARRVRESGVYCIIEPPPISMERIAEIAPQGIILSGGPASIYEPHSPRVDHDIFKLGLPILGICYGMQFMVDALGGQVQKVRKREYGFAELKTLGSDILLKKIPPRSQVWMSHGDAITRLPKGFKATARTTNTPIAAARDKKRRFYGLQFHPEVKHTVKGSQMLRSFIFDVCECKRKWSMKSFAQDKIAEIRETVGDQKVILGLSGGVDSSVTALLIHKAVGRQLTCVFVDNGLLRRDEAKNLRQVFKGHLKMNIRFVNAKKRFLSALEGITDPERKRKIIGKLFIDVFQEKARQLKGVEFLAQGTLYPDIIESRSAFGGPTAVIKSHHNVGGLPKKMKLKLIEPLSLLFKDEVRKLGAQLGLDKDLIWRQPFPGPGLAIRIIGAVTSKRLSILKEVDAVLLEEIRSAGYYRKLWQSFAVLLPLKSVGIMGDHRTYENIVALRAVTSKDAMTADWAKLPHTLLGRISNRIINEVPGVNRVVYDISSKPPSTIEWE